MAKKMIKKIRVTVLTLLAVLLLGSMPAFAGQVSAASNTQSEAKAKKQQYGWFKKGRYTYYRTRSGQLYKNTVKKIGNYQCRFDQKGWLVRKWNQTYWYDSTLTKHKWEKVRLTITEKGKNHILLKAKNKSKYMIGKQEIPQIYDKNNKKISFSKLKEGQAVWVYFDGFLLEVSPICFNDILKIKVIS